ncbi:hypothetical protein COUCH_26910 [Couchioplanes caeruleus]|uniref:vitamin K epoxide reductase family protein n=1 Tax=Couchioplanes caeruleus TaxID=56438 RepID=UPI0020BF16CA|nr:vitamin K epoxide reductase family protein [Couchioplanes caeruleus]UQU62647.1 hypothetical protein COUCH_26910 [Couchioplanes caeruleus]
MPTEVTPVRVRHNPSAWRRRAAIAALALAGCCVSLYLGLFQLHAIDDVWDPLFGTGSERVLTSALSRMLPVPDALLGAVAYAVEVILELAGGRDRWRSRPFWVFATGVVAGLLALTGIVLVVSQPLLTGTFCTLCLVSAAISITVAALMVPEVRAAAFAYRPAPDIRG